MTRSHQSGMTLIELLVAMAIGVGVTLVVATLLAVSENHKRTTTSTNDADQTGSYAVYALDRAIRGAGSAIAQADSSTTNQSVLGCILNVGSFLPRAGAFPAPFASNFLPGTTSNLRVAPVLIAAGQSDSPASDVLVVMGGSGSAGGVPRVQFGVGGATSLILENTIGFLPNDLVLVTNNNTGLYNNGCLVEQVATTSTTTLTLNSTAPYYTGGTTTTLTALAADTTSAVTPLGNAAANNVQFTMFGVGPNFTLYSYDLLQNQLKVQLTGTDTSQAIADGVIQMNAIYGIATTNTAVFSHWANPIAGGGYDITTVMTTPSLQASIISVRIGIVVRGEYFDKNAVSPTTLTLFSGLVDGNNASLAKPVTGLDPHYRYRTFEFTVPLRNMILLAGGP